MNFDLKPIPPFIDCRAREKGECSITGQDGKEEKLRLRLLKITNTDSLVVHSNTTYHDNFVHSLPIQIKG